MELDWTTFLLEIVNFLVLLWLLQRFLYRPILANLDARNRQIQQQTEQIEASRRQAETLQAQYQQQLNDWADQQAGKRQQLEQELEQARNQAWSQFNQTLADEAAKRQAREAVANASREATLLREAKTRAYQEVARMLERLASPDLTLAIVEMFLADLTALDSDQQLTLRHAAAGLPSPFTVEIKSAHALPTEKQNNLATALNQATGQILNPNFAVDASLLAGIRVLLGECQLHANLADELGFFRSQQPHEPNGR